MRRDVPVKSGPTAISVLVVLLRLCASLSLLLLPRNIRWRSIDWERPAQGVCIVHVLFFVSRETHGVRVFQ